MLQDKLPPAIPLWINGHVFLTVTPSFHEVRNPQSGDVLRRVPLCGTEEVQMAVAVAQAALAPWTGLPVEARMALLSALGDALAGYGEHFARLITEESGKELSQCSAEVDESVALLRSAVGNEDAGVVAVIGNNPDPLLASLRQAIPALAAGAVLIVRPSPEAPSALFALAELTGRCGFPDGVFNIVHGGELLVDSLCASNGVRLKYS